MSRPLKVAIADDSAFVRRLLAGYLDTAGCEVVGEAGSGAEALALVAHQRPDVLTLDLDMPGLDGLEALAILMRERPLPVLVVSGVSGRAAGRTLRALELGAVDFALKYSPRGEIDPQALRAEIVAKVRAAARVQVVRTLATGPRLVAGPHLAAAAGTNEPGSGPLATVMPFPLALHATPILAIGASTGGPVALRELLSSLPADFPAAILVVQHIPASFTTVLAAQLDRRTALRVRPAGHGDRLEAGLALVAPGGSHLLVRHDGRVQLEDGPEITGHCPSIDVTMQSVAQLFGRRARGVLLTGMGSDGVAGMAAIRARGGRTFAQSAETCVVAGMPQRAIEAGAVDVVASPAEIGHLLALELPASRRRLAC